MAPSAHNSLTQDGGKEMSTIIFVIILFMQQASETTEIKE